MGVTRKLYSTSSLTCLSLAAALLSMPFSAFANPTDGVVNAGSAIIISSGKTLDVNQSSNKAVIDWRSFDIHADETTNFKQPSSSSITLNRINSSTPSQIFGTLNANGNIVIVNQNGVLFGGGSKVDVNGLVATTADIDNQKFMTNDQLIFDKSGNPNASIINNGSITAKQAGMIGLVAPNVINHGTITANLGTVHLASGDKATVDFYGDKLMEVQIGDNVTSQLVSNSGTINAAGGKINLTAAAGGKIINSLVNIQGELNAPSVSQKDGQITISADGSNGTTKTGDSKVLINAKLDASGKNPGEKGGVVTVTADDIDVQSNALIDASGNTSGGTIKIGGDAHGKGTLKHSKTTTTENGAQLVNDAIDSGSGGSTVVWSDNKTVFNATATAKGGAHGGNGGYVEISSEGSDQIAPTAAINTSAAKGKTGTLLLDPYNIIIASGGTDTGGEGDAIDSTIDPGFVAAQLINNNLVLAANNDITVNSAIDATGGGSNLLTLVAGRSVYLNADLTLGANGLVISADTGPGDTYYDTSFNSYNGTTNPNYRDAGTAVIDTSSSDITTTGGVNIQMNYGNGLNDNSSGGINLGSINAYGLAAGSVNFYGSVPITLNNDITTTGGGSYFSGLVTLIPNSFNITDTNGGNILFTNNVVGQNLTVNTSGYADFYGDDNFYSLNVNAGLIYFDANSITTTGGGSNFNGPILIPGSGTTVTDTGGGNINFGGTIDSACGSNYGCSYLVADTAGAITFNGAVGGNASLAYLIIGQNYTPSATYLNNNVTTTNGGSTFNGPVIVDGNVNDTNSGNITFNGTIDDYNSGQSSLSITTSGSVTTGDIGSQTALGNVYIEGDTSVNVGNVYAVNLIDLSSINSISASSLTATNVAFDNFGGSSMGVGDGASGVLNISDALINNTHANSIQFYNDNNSDMNITISSFNETVYFSNFGGNIIASNPINASSDVNFYASNYIDLYGAVTTQGTLSLSGATIFTNDIQAYALNVSAGGGGFSPGNDGGNGDITTSGGGINVSGPTYGGGNIQDTNGGNITFGTIDEYNSGNGSVNISTSGTVTTGDIGDYAAPSSISIIGNSGIITGNLNSTGSIGLQAENSSNGVTTGTIDALGLEIVATNAPVSTGDIGDNLAPGYIDIYGDTGITTGNIHGTGDATFTTYDEGYAYGTTNINLGTVDLPGNLTITSYNGGVTLGSVGNNTAPNSISVNAASEIYLDGNITTNGGGSTFTGPVIVGGNITVSDVGNGDITFNNAVDGVNGGENFTVNSINGSVTFNGDIGDNEQLGLVSITSANTLTLPSITANRIFAQTTGSTADLIIANGGILDPADDHIQGVVTLVAGQNFINNEGANAIQPDRHSSWLIYATDPTDNYANGLTSDFHRYSCTYGGSCPTMGSGNGFLYSYTPTLTVTANSQNSTYGNTAPTYTYNATGYLTGDSSLDTLTASGGSIFGSLYTQGSNAGSYNITHWLATLASALGYNVTTYTGLTNGLTVAKKQITASWNAALEKIYGDTNPTVNYNNFTFNNLYGSDSASFFTANANYGSLGANSNAGTYTNGVSASFNAANYTVTNAPTTNLIIDKRSLNITTNDQSKTYGATNPTFTGSAYGLTTYDSTTGGVSFSFAPLSYTGNAGSYTIGASGNDTNGRLGNYNVTDTYGTFTVNKALLNVTATTGQQKTYGSADPTNYLYTYNGLVNGDTNENFTGALSRVAGSNAGTYAINQNTLAATGNYNIGTYTANNFTINKALLNVTATSGQQKTYGSVDPANYAYTYNGLVNGDTNESFTGALSRVAGSNAGTYAINQNTLAATGNYNIGNYTANDFTINKALLNVTATAGQQKTYGNADPASYTYTYNGLVNGDTNESFTGALSRVAGSNAGTYAINQNTLAATGNYNIGNYTANNFTINRALLNVMASSGQQKTYGDVDPASYAYIYNGLVNGDSSESFTGALSRTAGSNAGSYAINQNTLAATGNYNIGSYTANNFTINKALLSVTADSKTRSYGDANPAFTATYNGLTNGDNNSVVSGLIFNTPADVNSVVNTYAINLSGGSASNYLITDHNGTLTINPAILTVTPDNFSRYYAEGNPMFTGNISGFKNGQDASILTSPLVYSTTATITSPTGDYNITSSGSSAPNYSFNYLNGTLEIDPIPSVSQIIIPNTVTQVTQNPSINLGSKTLSSNYTTTSDDPNVVYVDNPSSQNSSNVPSTSNLHNSTVLNSEAKQKTSFHSYMNGLLFIDSKLSWIKNI